MDKITCCVAFVETQAMLGVSVMLSRDFDLDLRLKGSCFRYNTNQAIIMPQIIYNMVVYHIVKQFTIAYDVPVNL